MTTPGGTRITPAADGLCIAHENQRASRPSSHLSHHSDSDFLADEDGRDEMDGQLTRIVNEMSLHVNKLNNKNKGSANTYSVSRDRLLQPKSRHTRSSPGTRQLRRIWQQNPAESKEYLQNGAWIESLRSEGIDSHRNNNVRAWSAAQPDKNVSLDASSRADTHGSTHSHTSTCDSSRRHQKSLNLPQIQSMQKPKSWTHTK